MRATGARSTLAPPLQGALHACPLRTHDRPDPSSATCGMRGADRLIEALEAEGTDTIFGLPGGASLAIHDALHGRAIRHVLVRHEAGAGHAAEGYAKASGRVGV